MNTATSKTAIKEATAIGAAMGNAMVDSMEESVLARQAKMAALKKHSITAVKVVGLIGLGVVGTVGFDKFKARKANNGNTPALGYEPASGAAAE